MNGKFGEVIRKAKENQEANKLANQITSKPKDQITSNPEDQITSNPEDQITSNPEEKMVNLCVKVPESQRRHWAAEAKRQGITMTEVITEALSQKFGLPDNKITK
jgi:hypothetical protein